MTKDRFIELVNKDPVLLRKCKCWYARICAEAELDDMKLRTMWEKFYYGAQILPAKDMSSEETWDEMSIEDWSEEQFLTTMTNEEDPGV